MIYLFVLFVLLIFIGLKIDTKNNYLSKEQTTVVKGIFIILVIFSHFNSYVTYQSNLDLTYIKIINFFGQAMVAPFLFYSGYGVMEQINKKGINYIKSIPIKRILITIIKFDLALLIFYIIAILSNNEVSLIKFLLSLIAWDSLGNSNWYIFTILILYLFTYFSYILIKNKKISLLTTTILTCIYIVALYYFNIKPSFWYDTALCYILGMYYSNFKDKIYKCINYNNITYIVSFIIIILSCIILKKYSYHVSINIFLNLVFSLLIVIITMKLSIKSKILSWCGQHLFEIYILQRIPMILFKQINLFSNIYLYFIACIISTIIIVIVFKKISDKIISKIIPSQR